MIVEEVKGGSSRDNMLANTPVKRNAPMGNHKLQRQGSPVIQSQTPPIQRVKHSAMLLPLPRLQVDNLVGVGGSGGVANNDKILTSNDSISPINAKNHNQNREFNNNFDGIIMEETK